MEPLQLTRRLLPFTKLTFSVEGNRELTVVHGALLRSTCVTYPLLQIAPSPIHRRDIPAGWLIFTAIPGLGLIGAVMDGSVTRAPGELFGVLFLSGMFTACLYNTVKLSGNVLHFKDAATGVVLFSMFRSRPSAAVVDAFVDGLKSRIESFRSPDRASGDELAGLYKKHLDYLLQNEVLEPSEYHAILKRVNDKASRKKVFEIVP